jgi:hypothetical protein
MRRYLDRRHHLCRFRGSHRGDYYNDLIFAFNSVSNVIPEPATIAVFGISLVGLCLTGRRQSA